MSLTSFTFLVFVLAAVAGYYLIPRRFQWMWLLLFSYIYYISGGVKVVVFILFTTCTTYGCALWIQYIGKTVEEKKVARKKKRQITALALLLNFGMLGILKYTNFAIGNLNLLFDTGIREVHFLLPLGISFYTFQSMGYILDVYWEKAEAERNPFRFALFVSFFPQILQGPIGRYSRLAHQLYAEHSFDWVRTRRALELILWGFFKKMVLADNAAVFVDAAFNDPAGFSGLSIVGVLGYSIQLYGDFSGGMDVVMGVALLFGVELDQNFRRPYFAVSITDFWHRWHITLGNWMKDYIFYPLSLSKGMGKFGKFARKKFGKTIGRALPICIANVVVFLVVGVWHGAAWKFIVYGLYNGLIIGFSGLMAGNYRKWKKACHINDKAAWYHVFQVIRTFILVNISWFFDRADNLEVAVLMMKNAVMRTDFSQIWRVPATAGGPQHVNLIFWVIIVGCIVLFIVSFLQERGISMRESIAKWPVPAQLLLYLVLLFAIPVFGATPTLTGGFIYAQF